jgi:hypothetical protein
VVRETHELLLWLAEQALAGGAPAVRVGRLGFAGRNQVVYTLPPGGGGGREVGVGGGRVGPERGGVPVAKRPRV